MAGRRPWIAVLYAVLLGCSGGKETVLAPREEFYWTEQAVAFSPPPDGWRREGELSGGVRGIRFVKERSVGEAITIGEFVHVAERFRTEELQELLDGFDDMEWREFSQGMQKARMRVGSPYSDLEASVAEEVNEALTRAASAFASRDRETAKQEVEAALAAAGKLEYTLEDVLETVAMENLRRQERRHVDRFREREMEVGGEPAAAVEWSFEHSNRTYQRREIFFVHNSHLFVARFIGLEATVPLFDRVVRTVEFPE
jgi:hypothetical protein